MSSGWPEFPFKLISYTGANERPDVPTHHYCRRNAQIMALTHNTMFRGLNAVYNQAPGVTRDTQEAADLLFYCSVIWDFIHNHHVFEETIYFPELEAAAGTPGLMSENVEQHRQLEVGLNTFRKYAQDTPREKFDAETLRAFILDLAGPLELHLHGEIPTIIDLHDKVGSKTLKRIYGHMHDAAEKAANAFETAPFVLGCQDKTFLLDDEKPYFPEIPVIAHYVVDKILARSFAGAWRFNPSDMYGNPRPFGAPTASHKQVRFFVPSITTLAQICSVLIAVLAFYMLGPAWPAAMWTVTGTQ